MTSVKVMSAFMGLAWVALCLVPLTGSAQVREAWVQRFNTTGNADDRARIAVSDPQGNFYVVGETYQRYIVLKYNASGELQWERGFAGRPTSACVDSEGNLYVGGVQADYWWDFDIYIEKYSPSGSLLWSHTFDFMGNYDYLTCLVVDGSGNLYGIGTSDWWEDNPEGGGRNVCSFVAIKYSPAGDVVSVAAHDVAWDDEIYATHTTSGYLDAQDNIYITGHAPGSGGLEYLTLKFNAAGNLMWSRRYNAGLPGDDVPTCVVVDASGNVYVSGYSRGASSVDFATVKYSSAGSQLWVQRYNGPNDEEDRPISIQVDSAGNIYVAGYSTGLGTGLDYTLIKYTPAGARLWVRRYDRSQGEDKPIKMLLDESGAYLTGTSAGDYLTLKYDLNGGLLWTQVYTGVVSGRNTAADIALSGNAVYVTGASFGGTTRDDIASLRYTAAGANQWVARYNSLKPEREEATAIAVDGAGNILVAGRVEESLLVLKYAPDGALLWFARHTEPQVAEQRPLAIATDSTGNVYVCGYRRYPENAYDGFLLKFTSQGNLLWYRVYDAGYDDRFVRMALRPDGIYLTGFTVAGGYDILTMKYDFNGNELWQRVYHHEGNDYANALLVDSQGNAYVGGTSWQMEGSRYAFVLLKYAPDGSLSWERRYTYLQGDWKNDGITAMAFAENGDIIVTGYGARTEDNSDNDYVTLRYNPNGSLVWQQVFHEGNEVPIGVAVDSSTGSIYITGYSDRWDNSYYNFATIKLDSSGAVEWVRRANPGYDDYPVAIAIDQFGDIYVAGVADVEWRTWDDYLTLKYNPDGEVLWSRAYNGTGNWLDRLVAMTLDSRGNVYVTGTSWGDSTEYDIVTIRYAQRIEGDVNNDGCVDDADLLAVLFAFGQSGSNLPEDVNGDEVVDDADLLMVLFNFGSGC